MNDNTVRRNLTTSVILLALCLVMCVLALLLHMQALAAIMGAFALLQAFFCYMWWQRKRHPRRHFERKTGKRE